MNQYGQRAQVHWQTYLPSQYAEIADPEAFFEEMGSDLADQILDLADEIAGPDQRDEGYMGKLGRLNRARLEAEHTVMAEALPEPEADRRSEETTS
jgi:hypothetical protein